MFWEILYKIFKNSRNSLGNFGRNMRLMVGIPKMLCEFPIYAQAKDEGKSLQTINSNFVKNLKKILKKYQDTKQLILNQKPNNKM